MAAAMTKVSKGRHCLGWVGQSLCWEDIKIKVVTYIPWNDPRGFSARQVDVLGIERRLSDRGGDSLSSCSHHGKRTMHLTTVQQHNWSVSQ